jgi:menaquinol-cytochrome c reductase iron-sulfur subunit
MAEPKQKDSPLHDPAGGTPPGTESRRGALKGLVVIGSVAYAGALAAPAVRFLTAGGPATSTGEGGRWIKVARVADLKLGEPRRLEVVGDERDAFTLTRDQTLGSVWLIRSEGGVAAFSATCPHLGCAIDVTADRKAFACPCHTSRFALGGEAESGPSPRGMDPLQVRVVDGYVEVDFRRFKTGLSKREEVGA